MEGNYALKLATRPEPGSLAVGIKRHTFRELSAIQLECYFTFKPEASNLQLGEMDVRAAGVLFDIQDGGGDDAKRWMSHLRYLNDLEGERIARWQTKSETRAFAEIGNSARPCHTTTSAPSRGWMCPPSPSCSATTRSQRR